MCWANCRKLAALTRVRCVLGLRLGSGLDNDSVIEKAFTENWILITNDKDFGERVYREHRLHHDVILMRLKDERAKSKISVLKRLLENHVERLPEQFVLVTEKKSVLPVNSSFMRSNLPIESRHYRINPISRIKKARSIYFDLAFCYRLWRFPPAFVVTNSPKRVICTASCIGSC